MRLLFCVPFVCLLLLKVVQGDKSIISCLRQAGIYTIAGQDPGYDAERAVSRGLLTNPPSNEYIQAIRQLPDLTYGTLDCVRSP